MLDFVRDGHQVVVCKLDRIARSTKHLLETVEAKGVTFKVLNINLDTSTPTGKLMLTMLGGIAEFEREMMLDRRAEGIARAKSSEVKRLEAEGLKMQEMADQLGIGVASVYRILS